MLLGEQGLVKVIKSVEEIFTLTEEGTKYAKEGLPERNLLQSLGSGKPMSELKDPALKDRPRVAAQEGLGGHPRRRDQADRDQRPRERMRRCWKLCWLDRRAVQSLDSKASGRP